MKNITYTVNVSGKHQKESTLPYNSYCANNVTAIEIPADSHTEAENKAKAIGFIVLLVFI